MKDKCGREIRWKFEYYQSTFSVWYWRLKAGNGLIIADGGQRYASKRGVLRAIRNIKRPLYGVKVIEVMS